MNFFESLSDEILKHVAPKIAEAVIAATNAHLEDVAAHFKEGFIFRFSEEEAAAKLGISAVLLAQIRKKGLIDYTYSALPTINVAGKRQGGRISYLPRHLTEYLDRNEVKHYRGKTKPT